MGQWNYIPVSRHRRPPDDSTGFGTTIEYPSESTSWVQCSGHCAVVVLIIPDPPFQNVDLGRVCGSMAVEP